MSDDIRRSIGKLVSVSADKFAVEMNRSTDNFTVIGFDDVHYIARLGSFVIIPVQSEYVVAEIVGLREKDNSSGSRYGTSTEIVDISSVKYLDLVPLGTLPQARDGAFRFGVSTYPSLYADALYTVDSDLDRIFEVTGESENAKCTDDPDATRLKAISIGKSVVFSDYAIKIRIDEFFGGHAAILGNTGSGKSCTVASIIQSLFSKPDTYAAHGASFVLLDVNGEYRQSFAKLSSDIRRSHWSLPNGDDTDPSATEDKSETRHVFRLPHWFMSVEEWELLLRASERTQQPVLRTALGLSTLFSDENNADLVELQNHILASCIRHITQTDQSSPTKTDRILSILSTFSTTELRSSTIKPMISIDYGLMKDVERLNTFLAKYIKEAITIPDYANRPFPFENLGKALDLALLYEESHGNRQIREYCSQLITRFKWIREREEFSFLRVDPKTIVDYEKDTDRFVERFVGLERSGDSLQKASQITILDLNEAGDQVVEVASAVIARLIFERLRRADPRNRLPINVVLEEAHRYVAERPAGYAIEASKIFERIAKEGRKYGMFLLIASQRPSDLSRTVLSQCSNFVVHRIQNPDDLSHIRQMTPFISESIMKRLPSLPKQHALIFGNAVNLPTTFKVREASPRPKSDDARISELWFRSPTRPLDLILFKNKTASTATPKVPKK
jgi:DNA helicase HerA-like ATPase